MSSPAPLQPAIPALPVIPALYYRLFRLSFLSLPYLFYVSFLGLFGVLLFLLKTTKTRLDPLTRYGLWGVSGLLIVGCGFAGDVTQDGGIGRGEALLQLVNFLPFFLFFAALPTLLKGTDWLARLATHTVIAAIPINLLALVEYGLRSSAVPRFIRRIPIVHWLRDRPHTGRAMVMFTHPNSLANYLVLMLGLGLGLILYYAALKRQQAEAEPVKLGASPTLLWLYGGTYINLVGIFCSGSRNGLMVAIAQLLIFSLLINTSRVMRLTGVLGAVGIVAGAAWWGIGGRSLNLSTWADDPRQRVWGIALDMIRERPWLGWGLGNYKFQFPARLMAHYPACIAERQRPVVPVECADVTHPHNFWLLLGSEAGLPVLIVFTLLIGVVCWRAVHLVITQPMAATDRAVLLAYLLAFGGGVGAALFDVTLYDARLNITHWVLLAAIYSLTSDRASPGQSP